jgi:hypothetical protein
MVLEDGFVEFTKEFRNVLEFTSLPVGTRTSKSSGKL